jgi:hypothetical protein
MHIRANAGSEARNESSRDRRLHPLAPVQLGLLVGRDHPLEELGEDRVVGGQEAVFAAGE